MWNRSSHKMKPQTPSYQNYACGVVFDKSAPEGVTVFFLDIHPKEKIERKQNKAFFA